MALSLAQSLAQSFALSGNQPNGRYPWTPDFPIRGPFPPSLLALPRSHAASFSSTLFLQERFFRRKDFSSARTAFSIFFRENRPISSGGRRIHGGNRRTRMPFQTGNSLGTTVFSMHELAQTQCEAAANRQKHGFL